MKSVILAGGKGSRGRPYTDYFPKAMTPINDRPLVDHIVRHLESFELIDEIVMVSDFNGLGGQIKNYFGSDRDITYVQDSGNGTAGDLLHARSILDGQSEFMLWFVDNLCAVSPEKMRDVFIEKKSSAVIATRTSRREETGFAVVQDGIVKEFMEKPVMQLPASECLGIYILGSDVMDRIGQMQKSKINMSYDILQPLSAEGRISAYDIGDMEWIDVESPTVVDRNADIVGRITVQMGQ